MSFCKLVHNFGVKIASSARLYSPQHRVDEIVNLAMRFGFTGSEIVALDIGAGTSEISRLVANILKIRIIALDLNHNISSSKKAVGVEPIVADAHHLPFRNYVFDFSLVVSVLEHFKNPEVAVREMSRVLRNRGLVMLMLPNIEWFIDTATKWPLLYFAPSSIREIVTKSTGFSGYLNFEVTLKNVGKMFLKHNLQLTYKRAYWQGLKKIRFPWPPAWHLVFSKIN